MDRAPPCRPTSRHARAQARYHLHRKRHSSTHHERWERAMKIGTGVGGWLRDIGAAAKAAEARGYDYVTCGELSHDSMLTMTVAATATQRIELNTSVTIAFPRSPM